MPHYRYDGDQPANLVIRDADGYLDEVLQPGQEFDVPNHIHNPVFSRLDGKTWVPALRDPALISEFRSEPEPEEAPPPAKSKTTPAKEEAE